MDVQPEILAGAGGAAAIVLGLVMLLVRRRRKRPSAAEAKPRLAAFDSIGSRGSLWDRIQGALTRGADQDDLYRELEEILITADVGIRTTARLLDRLREQGSRLADPEQLRAALRDEVLALLGPVVDVGLGTKPHVIVVVGVNGVGKTTTIAKLANYHLSQGRKVLLVAADTFRAAAVDQLVLWAERLGIECIRQQGGTDPSAVAYDGIRAAVAREVDVVIVDTAGRLHVKANLVAELQKLLRILGRECPDAPHEAFLVIDATTGQNAVAQAKVFKEALPLTGIILTKLDGTAKGGSILGIRAEVDLPVRYVGFGEKPADFQAFDPIAFADALLAPHQA